MDSVNNGLPVSSLKMTPAYYEPAANDIARRQPENGTAKNSGALADKLNISHDAKNGIAAAEAKNLDPIQPHLTSSAPVSAAQSTFQKSVEPGLNNSSREIKSKEARKDEEYSKNEEGSEQNAEAMADESGSGFYITLPQNETSQNASSNGQNNSARVSLSRKFGMSRMSSGSLVDLKI